ncbi:MAG: SIMPL domain-containing protein [Gallionella sp.]
MLRISLLLSLLFNTVFVHAESEPYNRVNFQVEVARVVSNDLISARLSVEIQDKSPATVAQQINTVLNDALSKSQKSIEVKATSGNQNTYPVYGKNNQVDAWRGRAEINLESRDFKATGELIMQLQQHMQLANIQFSIAPDTRTRTENDLVSEVIKAFQTRANAISKAMGTNGFKIVSLFINSGGNLPVPLARPMMRSALAVESSIPSPDFEAGDSRLTVQASGTIELQ